jgi:hypothetical protein
MNMDPSTPFGAVITGVLTTVVGAGALAFLAWFGGPLKWFVLNRNLYQLISNGRRFHFTFNPGTGQSKFITFMPSGEIGEGRNQNEHTWKIRHGLLEIYADDGTIYSRFSHDKGSGYLKHTNDADLRSIHGQYLQPSLVRLTNSGVRQ